MAGFASLVVFGFLGLSVIYLLISFYSRSVRREKLEKEWAADHPGDTDEAARDAFVEDGMAAYQNSLRPKLILLVYIIPVVLVILSLVIRNSN